MTVTLSFKWIVRLVALLIVGGLGYGAFISGRWCYQRLVASELTYQFLVSAPPAGGTLNRAALLEEMIKEYQQQHPPVAKPPALPGK